MLVWADNDRVDSQAMLSAFLTYRQRCHGLARTQLDDLFMIRHRHPPFYVIGGQRIVPEEPAAPVPEVACAAPQCARCEAQRGGYQFKWIHHRWAQAYRAQAWRERGASRAFRATSSRTSRMASSLQRP